MQAVDEGAGAPLLGAWAPQLQKSRVYEQILLDVILGELPPGSRLDEQRLTERYAAGLAGIRDALGRLALEGLVVRRPRSGTTVAPIEMNEVREAYDARRLIEPQCAALAAGLATANDLAALRGAFAGGPEAAAARDIRALLDMDQRFHMSVARAGRNPTLARLIAPLQHKAARVWVRGMREAGQLEILEDIDRHLAVADAIAARDVEGARAAMLQALGAYDDLAERLSG